MTVFTINRELCRKDGICAKVCPAQIISGLEGEYPEENPGAGERCIACGQCLAFCPHGACSVTRLEHVGKPEKIARKDLPPAVSVDALVKTRRSVRAYKEAPVPKDTLEALIQTARYAPTASNRRDVRWIVIHDRQKLMALGDIMAGWMEELLQNDPATAALVNAGALVERWSKGDDVFFRGAPHLVLAVSAMPSWGLVDTAIAATTLELLAHGHGLGACWAGYFMHVAESFSPLRAAVGVNGQDILGGALMLGYPALKATSVPPRTPAPVAWIG